MTTLKISDLSVGDWVMCNEDKYRVMGITMFHELDLLKSSESFRTSIDNIEPIPITAEVLEKNGWRNIEKEVLGDDYVYDGEKRVWDDGNCRIDICEAKQGVFWYSWGNEYYMWRLEYVHQLQHLIRLAGVDKETNL